jgi:hypothetical protein
MFKHAPRPLVTLLSLVIASKVALVAASNDSLFPGLFWPLLFAALGLSALFGKQSAATALGYVFYVVGVLSLLLPVVGTAQSMFGIVTSVVWGALAVGTARYIFQSQAVKAFYASGTATPLAGG